MAIWGRCVLWLWNHHSRYVLKRSTCDYKDASISVCVTIACFWLDTLSGAAFPLSGLDASMWLFWWFPGFCSCYWNWTVEYSNGYLFCPFIYHNGFYRVLDVGTSICGSSDSLIESYTQRHLAGRLLPYGLFYRLSFTLIVVMMMMLILTKRNACISWFSSSMPTTGYSQSILLQST